MRAPDTVEFTDDRGARHIGQIVQRAWVNGRPAWAIETPAGRFNVPVELVRPVPR